MDTPRIVFCGTPDYSVPYLDALVHGGFTPIVVITQPDRAKGRSGTPTESPVKRYAMKADIPVLQPESVNTPEFVAEIAALDPDLLVVVAFGQILKQDFLDVFPRGTINVHPSWLPRHRGATPLQNTILAGDTETGVTIMLMDAKMDHGPILAQAPLTISTDETLLGLAQKTIAIGAPLLVNTLRTWLDGSIVPVEQDHEKATFTKLLKKEDGKIDWNEASFDIERKVRALSPWPGVWTEMHGKRVKIFEIAHMPITVHETSRNPIQHGNVFVLGKELFVTCGDNTALSIKKLQPEGKNPMTAEEYINGMKGK